MPAEQLPEKRYKCQHCKKRRLSSEYELTQSGCHKYRCIPCDEKARREDTKFCPRCKQIKDRKYDFGRRKNGHIKDFCNACVRHGIKTHFFCRRCDEHLPREMFELYTNGRAKAFCRECVPESEIYRTCRKCGVHKNVDDFVRYKNGSISLWCQLCRTARAMASGTRPVEAASPCMECGKRFRLTMPASRRERIKYCSRDCANKAATVPERECTTCLKVKPSSQFDTKQSGRGKRDYCMQCQKRKLAGDFSRTSNRLSIKEMYHYLRRHAVAVGNPVSLSLNEVANLATKPCDLCGADMQCLILKDRLAPSCLENIAPCCVPCRKFLRIRPYPELVQWAIGVAQGRSNSGERLFAAFGKTKQSKRAIERQERKARTKLKWIHPETPMLQPLHESFEDKLKRIAAGHGYQGQRNLSEDGDDGHQED